MEPTVRDVLAFHRVDRAAYERLLSLGAGRRPARDAVALLMWLHRSAGADAVAALCHLVRTPADAARLVSDARAVLLHGGAAAAWAWPPCHHHHAAAVTPLLVSPVCAAVDVRRYLELVPDDADPRRGVADVLDGVGALVFDDRLYALLRHYEEEEEDSGSGGPLPAELAAPYRGRNLACAPLPPPSGIAAEDDDDDGGGGGGRSLFVTFSKGFPLTREEIDAHFTERWGDECVERVLIKKTPPGEQPTYGRVVFRRAAVAAAVLGGRRLLKLVVNGRQLWARKYVPRAQQHQ